MKKFTFILAAAAGYLFFSNKKSTEKKIEELKTSIENNAAYTDSKFQQQEEKQRYSSYLKFEKCELKMRKLSGKKCHFKFSVWIKNTATVSIKVKDVTASIYMYSRHITNVSSTDALTIAPNSTGEFIVASGFHSRTQRAIMPNNIYEKYKKDLAAQCNKKLFSSCVYKAVGKSVDITADCALSVVSTAGIAGQTVSQKDVAGKAVYSSANGDYNCTGSFEVI